MKTLFQRSKANPILTPRHMPIPCAAVMNPGATEQNGEVVLLLRVEDQTGCSSIHIARSKNGESNWRVDPEPFLKYGDPRFSYENWGCEDARATYLADENQWYISYTAYSQAGAAVALARSKDLVTAERLGLIFSPNNKDAALFSHQLNGRWGILHRPDAGGIEHIWSAYSPDLVHWGEPHCVLPEGGGAAWDALKVGAGPPPVLTDEGWLLIYHGVKRYGSALVYRVGLALLHKDMPHMMIARSPDWIFQAQEPYELTGLIPNVVFPTGLLVRGDELWMYYGAADTYVCLATAKLQDVLAVLHKPEARKGVITCDCQIIPISRVAKRAGLSSVRLGGMAKRTCHGGARREAGSAAMF
ncbi:MAG: glycoside hydrolase family 130 protein [Planctomycetota bacterium]